jgi:hypothetical protein
MILLGSACIGLTGNVYTGVATRTARLRGAQKLCSINSSAGGTQREIAQARDRNGNEHVRPQFESAFQTVYS